MFSNRFYGLSGDERPENRFGSSKILKIWWNRAKIPPNRQTEPNRTKSSKKRAKSSLHGTTTLAAPSDLPERFYRTQNSFLIVLNIFFSEKLEKPSREGLGRPQSGGWSHWHHPVITVPRLDFTSFYMIFSKFSELWAVIGRLGGIVCGFCVTEPSNRLPRA